MTEYIRVGNHKLNEYVENFLKNSILGKDFGVFYVTVSVYDKKKDSHLTYFNDDTLIKEIDKNFGTKGYLALQNVRKTRSNGIITYENSMLNMDAKCYEEELLLNSDNLIIDRIKNEYKSWVSIINSNFESSVSLNLTSNILFRKYNGNKEQDIYFKNYQLVENLKNDLFIKVFEMIQNGDYDFYDSKSLCP